MSTTEKPGEEKWTAADAVPWPQPNLVVPPHRSEYFPYEPGTFQIRDPNPTIDDGWDVSGDWDHHPEHGIVILSMNLVRSEYVLDGAPPDKALRRTDDELSKKGIRSTDLKRLKVGSVRDVIRQSAADALEDPFFQVSPDQNVGIVRRELDVLAAVASSGRSTGRPRDPDEQLDRWARDVMGLLQDSSRPLYVQLADLWGISKNTVKNYRLPLLKRTRRLAGAGRAITAGPNYPGKETDDG